MTRIVRLVTLVWVVGLLLCAPAAASAQESTTGTVLSIAREVAIDPTTYAPAVISFAAMMEDWKTSQVLFAHGWVETNPRFAVSGQANDLPVSYEAGKRLIRRDALTVLQYSLMNNVAAAVTARALASRYPSHKKLVRTLSWVERIAFASIVAYRNSADYLRQADRNRRLAREYGYVR